MENTFPMVAKTFQGLEDVLRDELISLGAENVEMGRRMVSFEGDLEMMYRANLCCRTALRILKPIEKFTASDPDELYDIVRDIEWEKYMTPKTTFAIDATVNSGEFTHSKFVTYRVKDGIVDHFRDTAGERPSIRVSGYDILFNVHIDSDRVTISLDSSGEPLYKRGYREDQTEAPINEVLAAGIIMKTGWRGDCNFADPMCGSGTFLVEAALIAANINPGIYRQHFAFEKWPDFDADLFEELYNDDSGERDFAFKIYGGDIDPEAVAIARRNVKGAQVEDMVEISCRDMKDWTENPDPGILVMNPPYGHRLKPDDVFELYRTIGNSLKRNFGGWHAWIIGMDDDNVKGIGLKPSVKIPMLNGSLECTLREYVLFDGNYSDFRANGGAIKGFDDEDEHDRGPRRMRASDDEWKRETRKFGHHDRDREKKPFRKDNDRNRDGFKKSFRRDDDDRGGYKKPFRRDDDDRGGYKKPFRRDDDRDGNRGGFKKPFRRDDERDGNRDGYKKPFRQAREVRPQGPRISADKQINYDTDSETRFRPRKKK